MSPAHGNVYHIMHTEQGGGGGRMQHIVIVDEEDNVIGEEDKEKCHDGDGILHRAFLTMVFNNSGELILARRGEGKRLWPGFWDGTVASHVIKDESYEQASQRRLKQEIGIETDTVHYLFKFRYKAGYGNIGTEHEICAVTAVSGIDTGSLSPDSDEISDIRTISLHALMDDLGKNWNSYTPWLILALEHINAQSIAM